MKKQPYNTIFEFLEQYENKGYKRHVIKPRAKIGEFSDYILTNRTEHDFIVIKRFSQFEFTIKHYSKIPQKYLIYTY